MNLKIIHTSDVHGFVSELHHGYEHILNYTKKLNGDVIKIDTGDAIQGSPAMIFYKNHQTTYDNPVIQAFNQIEYDYFVPGNHDFNYGLDYLKNFTDHIKAKTLCQNVYQDQQLFFHHGYDVKVIDSKKILIVGYTNHFVPKWEKEETIKGLKFENPTIHYQKWIKQLKENLQPDLTVVAYHGGFNCDEHYQLYGEEESENVGCQLLIPEIDILLTSHEHRLFVKNHKHQWISQPGYQGAHLIEYDIHFTHHSKIINATIVPLIDEKIVHQFQYIDHFKDNLNQYLNQTIAINHGASLRMEDPIQDRIKKPLIAQLFNHVQMETTGAQISLCSFGNDVKGFPNDIRIKDVLETYVFSNTLVLCEITGKTLKKALEENSRFFKVIQNKIVINERFLKPKKMFFQYDFYDGINYTMILNEGENNVIKELSFHGQDILDTDTFLITMNSYRYLGGGYQTWQKELKVIQEFPLDVAELMIDYLTKHQVIQLEKLNNIKIRID